jgi:hypothetical protein
MKTIEKIKNYSWAITLILVLFMLFRQCGVNRDIDRMEKSVKSINNKVDSLVIPTKEDVRKEMNETMFNFLIYEDDFDKGKASLSDIKSKINTEK